MEVKQAKPDHPIHELIVRRWSPYGYDPRPVAKDVLRSLFEAARWAASSYNEQPWSYIVATREDKTEHERLLSCLVEPNQAWAKAAPVLAIGVTSLRFRHNGKPNRMAYHDLGLAAANLTFEATSRGLFVHQMAGILPDRVRELYAVPEGHDPVTALAIGHAANPDDLAGELRERDLAPRQRKPLKEFVHGGRWGETSPIVG